MLTKYLLLTMKGLYPDGTGFFQQDLAPCHTSKVMQSFFKKSKLHVLDWPGNSSDLNPMENLWTIVKKRLGKCDCSTITKLI